MSLLWVETRVENRDLCLSNQARYPSVLCRNQHSMWEAGLLGMAEFWTLQSTLGFLTFYTGFPISLATLNAIFFFPEALGFADAKAFPKCSVAIFHNGKCALKMLAVKFNACVLVSLSLSHCYCFFFQDMTFTSMMNQEKPVKSS